MGHFDRTICDCCVCPMQCVLEQLVGETIRVATLVGVIDNVMLLDVKSFIASTSEGELPICNISGVEFIGVDIALALKPIQKSTGKCSCCEGPITNLANSLIGQIVDIEFINFIGSGRIRDVGEGIICFQDFVISSCFTTKIIPVASSVSLSERTNSSFWSRET
ncbi:hypothetical protein [Chengkuizengella sediminis]|uniref:hypothetical protein n=1 Tax=Chengkuizengella sediminis TaxID=1885917 RepID=UPI0013895D8F|nr:hypothetical protein [Chengkuizengella sediminis]NDI33603.1 hypothetical protein [Chengkuizengella sediminis]